MFLCVCVCVPTLPTSCGRKVLPPRPCSYVVWCCARVGPLLFFMIYLLFISTYITLLFYLFTFFKNWLRGYINHQSHSSGRQHVWLSKT
ncbi:hypothetical protein T492DRAFT_1107690 [Pavlovales sp. CCMP2436]|nr:hypothetical protein T492DRAFT_1107690 [Pavlovales sp. CCMP2436]